MSHTTNLSLEDYLKTQDNGLNFVMISDLQKEVIKEKIKRLEDFHNGTLDVANTTEQGELLEGVMSSIMDGIEIFSYTTNTRTSGNEIDLSVKISESGRILLETHPHLIRNDFPDFFRVECKNYTDNLGITYVNKFHSLLETHGLEKFGLLVTYKGLTGQDLVSWSASTGFIKKIALKHCVNSELPLILNIDIEKFKRLESLDFNFFEWIDEMRVQLLTDVNSDFNRTGEN